MSEDLTDEDQVRDDWETIKTRILELDPKNTSLWETIDRVTCFIETFTD